MVNNSNSLDFELGHVHLKVTDLERSVKFYTDVLELAETEHRNKYVFLSWGQHHHDIALQEVYGSSDSTGPGLYHVAVEVPERSDLDTLYNRATNWTDEVSAVDHGISESLYFSDPDGNGIEVYVDTRDEKGLTEWKGQTRRLKMD